MFRESDDDIKKHFKLDESRFQVFFEFNNKLNWFGILNFCLVFHTKNSKGIETHYDEMLSAFFWHKDTKALRHEVFL